METNHEGRVVIRYERGESREWPWSITHEDGQPVLTITDLDDSSLGIVLRAIAQANESATSTVDGATMRSSARLSA